MLTGTPLQNNMFEFFIMVEFVHPGLLGTKAEFGRKFEKVLMKEQSLDSTNFAFSFRFKKSGVKSGAKN